MPQISAGLLAWRKGPDGPQVLLVHPGGPYWRSKDAAAWSIPKGLVDPGEDPLAAARREFAEELGLAVAGDFAPLAPCRTPGGKIVLAWLVEADLDVARIASNSFEMEWPPRSGRRETFPEVDRAGYFPEALALEKVHKGQRPVIEEAFARLAAG